MSTKRCYYETLEVERSADESGLKSAFRKLAMKWHPDKNPGDASSEVRFKEINEAYEILKDPQKRAAYDRVRHAQGFFQVERTCPTCHGRGQTIEDPCTSCTGSGRVTRERALQVNIPAGVEDGTRIRLAGEGEAGVRGGPPGDLYIFLSLATHEFFQRDGADLHCRVPISMVAAALGGEFEVPTIDKGKTKVKVPAGTQAGRRFRIASKGMPVLRSRQTGDMYVQVMVETPQNLTKKQQELLAEFEKLSSGATQPDAAGFFTKVKDFFGNRAGS